MKKVLCFVCDEMADFEVVLLLHHLKSQGKREIVTTGYDLTAVVSQAGLTYLPNCTIGQAMDLPDVEALIFPGGPIRPQREELSELIRKVYNEKKLVAAICFGPQYLGRAGILDRHRFTTSCSEDHIRSLHVPDPYPRHNYVAERVVCDGNVITAKGEAFVDFAFSVLDYLDVYAGQQETAQAFYNEITHRA